MQILGRAAGKALHAVVTNRGRDRDRRAVRANRRRRTVGAQRAIGRGPHPQAKLDATLVNVTERVTRRMRKAGRAGRTVTLRLRFGDFSRATRSRTLPEATDATGAVLAAARALLEAAMPMIARRGVTLVGIAVSGLSDTGAGVQLVLPLERRRGADLDRALDEVRDRFGAGALMRAALLGSDARHAPVLLPGDDTGGRL